MTIMEFLTDNTIKFLKDWQYWATNGAPEQAPFKRKDPLCYAVEDWIKFKHPEYTESQKNIETSIMVRGLEKTFKAEGLDQTMPFYPRDANSNKEWDTESWHRERKQGEMHTNCIRLAWVNAHIIGDR